MTSLVIIESPYSGQVKRNVRYAIRAMRDSILRGEAPFASHLLYTQPGVLDDNIPAERALGLAVGHSWYQIANKCVVYEDFGHSSGMLQGIEAAKRCNVPIEFRRIGCEVPLSRGYFALVDGDMYEQIVKQKWHAVVTPRHVYARRSYAKNFFRYMHHFVLGIWADELNGLVVDHKNRNSLDNRKENLQIISNGENVKNSNYYKPSTGVTYKLNVDRWYAYKTVENSNKTIHLGVYKTKKEALDAVGAYNASH